VSDAVARNKRAGETIERVVSTTIPEFGLVPDEVAIEYDAVATSAVFPATDLPMVGLCVVERGTPVEIKSAVRRLSSGKRGRLYFRPAQHESLVEAGGVYCITVREGEAVLAMKIVPAVVVEDLLPGWLDGGDGRSDYAQLAWSNLIAPDEVEEVGSA